MPTELEKQETESQRKNPMSGSLVKIDPQDYTSLMAVMCGIPPIEKLNGATEDQIDRWRAVKTRYLSLKDALKAYFQGEMNPLNEDVSPVLVELTALDRDCWLAFYTLIQYAWGAIIEEIPEFAEMGLTTPGQTLAAAIKQAADFHVSPAYQKYFRWTPSDRRSLYRKSADVAKGKTVPAKTKTVETKTKQLARYVDQYCQIEDICLSVCQKLKEQKLKKDNRLRQYFGNYKKAQEARFKFLRANLLTEKKRVKGHEYRNGSYFLMSAAGGSPAS